MELFDIRREYSQGKLSREQLPKDPLVLFEQWLQQAVDAGLPDPTAMTVATVDEQGQPFQRIVLLKEVSAQGMVFYTNLGSRKAKHIQSNQKISLHFPWHILERQVHITGSASALSKTEVMKYFLSRPKESQLAAWASKQSNRLSTRAALESKYFELKQKFSQGEIPVPTFWGGYRVSIESIEFWQGGEHRLHDRFLYSLLRNNSESSILKSNNLEQNAWTIERLAP